jgi:hypothetical protein
MMAATSDTTGRLLPATEPEPEPEPEPELAELPAPGQQPDDDGRVLTAADDGSSGGPLRCALRYALHVLRNEPRSGVQGIDRQRRALHSMRGRWAMESILGATLPGWSYCLLVHRLFMYARRRERQPVLLPLSQVCFKIGRLQRGKFAMADVACPCLAVATEENPGRLRYRVVRSRTHHSSSHPPTESTSLDLPMPGMRCAPAGLRCNTHWYTVAW